MTTRRKFYIGAIYETFDGDEDDENLTVEDLASRLRGWGFQAVDVEAAQ